jgi:hypothetical protein
MNRNATHQKDMAIAIDQALQSYEQYGRTQQPNFCSDKAFP